MPDTHPFGDCCSLISEPVFSWNGQGHSPENEPARRLLQWLEQEGITLQTLLESPGLPLRRVETAPGQGLLVLWENATQQRFLEQQASFGRLAAGFVHNLNNPLNALGGLIQLLQMKLGENRDLDKMERQLDILAALVRCSGERYRKLHSRTEGLALAWERIIQQELEFYWADGVLKHQVKTTVDVAPDRISPLEFGDASWLFDRLLEALIACIEGRGSHELVIRIEQDWPCLTLAGDQAWNRERALLRFADGRLQTLLDAHRRDLVCIAEGNSITLYTQERT
jgi:signal transduction histidine kinase